MTKEQANEGRVNFAGKEGERWRASTYCPADFGGAKHFYGATPEEADTKRQAYLNAANENTPSTKIIDSSNYMGADRE